MRFWLCQAGCHCRRDLGHSLRYALLEGLLAELTCAPVSILFAGTINYAAPEIVDCQYNISVDLWAVGCITYFLLFGIPPFYSEKDDDDEVMDQLMEAKANINVIKVNCWCCVLLASQPARSFPRTPRAPKRPRRSFWRCSLPIRPSGMCEGGGACIHSRGLDFFFNQADGVRGPHARLVLSLWAFR